MLKIINWAYVLQIFLSAAAALIAITVHEVSHGYVAYLMGDMTAKQDGRLSLNPLKHLDWIGALCLIFFHIGWAKPVPINPYMFKNRKKGIIYVSLAGPASNFLLAILSMIVMCFLYPASSMSIGTVGIIFYSFLLSLSAVNIGLGIFNLIPIPPLDGSKVLAQFLPLKAKIAYLKFERYGGLLLFLLIYFGRLSEYLNIALNFVFNHLYQFISGVIL